MGRLTQECAYEHWHRMLFARFLAETDLLIEPESGVAISLDEARELAREQGADWLELASDYAERMLPQIFRKDDPVLAVALPAETRSELEDLLKALPREVFLADDSLGWVYQFWQADRKDEVNRSEKKIGADELPAVTQLFTEDYMVLFLLHNTLGAWWAGKVLAANPNLAASAKSEDELRAACRVGDVEWTYLRFVRDKSDDGDEGPWRPAAGTFEGWPKAAKDITVLDPCMGSGHFLVFALPILVAFRMAEEGLTREAAVEAVLRDNLFGLEIDQRCTQIAAFNLAFAAWRMVGYRPLPRLNLACSGLAIGVTKAEWLRLAEKAVTAADPAAKRDLFGVEQNIFTSGLEARIKNGLEALYDLFAKAPWLGSLIDPRRAGADIFREGFDKLEPLLGHVLKAADTDEAREMAVAAQGMAKAAELLGSRYSLVATNVPYLKRGNQDAILQEYCSSFYSLSKGNLACSAFERCVEFCQNGGSAAVVVINELLSLKGYKTLREKLLKKWHWNSIARLGPGAFEAIQGEVVNVSLVTASRQPPVSMSTFAALDATESQTPSHKAKQIKSGPALSLWQAKQLRNPDSRIILTQLDERPLLSKFVRFGKGSTTGDSPHYHRNFWELDRLAPQIVPWLDDPKAGDLWSGRSLVSIVPLDDDTLNQERGCLIRGQEVWGKSGIAVNKMGGFTPILYSGEVFDDNIGVLGSDDPEIITAALCYVQSGEYAAALRTIDQAIKVTAATLTKVPFDLERWSEVAARNYSNGLPQPISRDPTQWLHVGNPTESDDALHVAIARLIGYRWPRQTGSNFNGCPAIGPDGLEQHADVDGIVCLTATKGEAPAQERLIALLADAFGAEWSAAKLASLLAEVGFAGKTLDDWLRDGFFEQHCALFHQRPFIWHVWDGRRDGFHALVNYHRLAAPGGEGRRTLEKLIYSYLGDWIDRQRAEQKAGIEGADARLAHAEHLRAELIKILEGEPPYDIFVRWKPLHEQPIGWEPDINDGVRMNIRPFMTARPLAARAKGACILRTTPKIKWDKDRGKEPSREKADYPWFWGWDPEDPNLATDFAGGSAFDGNRWNDLHYTRAAKEVARDR
ncbi:MAG: Eco57I restriction-modification methylase domain-containing protein, partial [Hyphomicrobium sp.]